MDRTWSKIKKDFLMGNKQVREKEKRKRRSIRNDHKIVKL